MFILYAEKNRLSVQERESVTSGSVNVCPVQFQFSPDWDGMVPTAVFRAGWKSATVVLDQNGECVIPWEVLAKPRCRLEAGVYGVRDGDVVLPTVWADLGMILEGAEPGEPARPPTAGVFEQVMGELAAVRELVAALRAPDHSLLPGRSAPAQHPIQAVEGLEEALDRIPAAMTVQELGDILEGRAPPPAEGSFLGVAAAAALWARIGEALDRKQDREEAAPEEEVAEMLEDVFGSPGGGGIQDYRETATVEETQAMLDEVFGSPGGGGIQDYRETVTAEETQAMLDEVFGPAKAGGGPQPPHNMK